MAQEWYQGWYVIQSKCQGQEFNTAPDPCGVTGAVLYFFELSGVADNPSLALAAWAFALEVEEVFFGHLLTLCPAPPQNMQCRIGGLAGLLFTGLVIKLLGFLGNFGLMLPVACIDLLNQLAYTREGRWFSNLGNFILDPISKTLVQLVSESRISPGDLGCEVIEINKIFYHPLIVLHLESFKLILCWYAKGTTKIAKHAWALDQSVALWGSESVIWG